MMEKGQEEDGEVDGRGRLIRGQMNYISVSPLVLCTGRVGGPLSFGHYCASLL
jgi:hypothetical protein